VGEGRGREEKGGMEAGRGERRGGEGKRREESGS
jgi:hypothetical protein